MSSSLVQIKKSVRWESNHGLVATKQMLFHLIVKLAKEQILYIEP